MRKMMMKQRIRAIQVKFSRKCTAVTMIMRLINLTNITNKQYKSSCANLNLKHQLHILSKKLIKF